MKKILLSIFFILESCTSANIKLRNDLTTQLKQDIEDVCFKNNEKITIYDYRILKIDTVSENTIDTLRRAVFLNKIILFSNISHSSISLANLEIDQAKLHRSIGMYQLSLIDSSNARKHLNESIFWKDSIDCYQKKDSLLDMKILHRKNPAPVYEVKYFLKASTISDSTKNVMDSLYAYYSVDLKQIHY